MWLEDICVPHWSLPELWILGFGLHLSVNSAAFWPHELMIAQKVHSTATCNYSFKVEHGTCTENRVSTTYIRVELYIFTVSCSIYSFDSTCIATHAGSFDLKVKCQMVCFCSLLLRNSIHEMVKKTNISLCFPLIWQFGHSCKLL